VNEIWLDKSGSELRVLYRNVGYRTFRAKATHDLLITTTLVTPEQDRHLMKGNILFIYQLIGPLFPDIYPFERYYGLFWRKYYYNRKTYLMIPQ
jgi:hypothetical protein